MSLQSSTVVFVVVLGGLAVWLSCLTLDPMFASSTLAEGDRFLMAMKILSTSSFGAEVKPSVPCRKILRHFFGSLFYDAFSVTRLYSVDKRVTSE
jgi:hypothetical protein